MCIIAICKEKTLPKDEFMESFRCNKDGFGFAWRENGRVEYVKGIMKADEAWETYKLFNKTVKDVFPHILHFRIGSPVTQELTHPFIITEDSKLFLNSQDARKEIGFESVMFHNGVVTGWKDYLVPLFLKLGYIPDGKWSDTRLVAMLVKELGNEILSFMSGKFVIMTPDKIMLNESDWEEDPALKGILFSNKSYKVTRRTEALWDHWKKPEYTNYTSIISKDLIDLDEFII